MTAAVDVEAVRDGRGFAVLVERHRRELHRHCQRILRSPERAEDAVQEALLRAWRAREEFAGRATARSWLHRIATNACLDEARRAAARGPAAVPLDEDADRTAPAALTPEAVLEAGDALERAWVVVMELLPARQRAVLVLRGVLELRAAETARLLGTTTAAVNSARSAGRGHDRGGGPGGRRRGGEPGRRVNNDDRVRRRP